MLKRQMRHFVRGSLLIGGLAVILTALCAGNAAASYVDCSGSYSSYFGTPTTTGAGAIDTNFNNYIEITKENGAGSAYYSETIDLSGSQGMIKGNFDFRVSTYYWDWSAHNDNTGSPLPPVGVGGLDTLHVLTDGNGNWFDISVVRPGAGAGSSYTNRIKVRTSAGAEFLSRNSYDFRTSGWHTVQYFVRVTAIDDDTDRVEMKLKIDNNDEGLFEWEGAKDSVHIDSWDTALYGFGADYSTAIDYKMRNIKLEDAATGDFYFAPPSVGSFSGTNYWYSTDDSSDLGDTEEGDCDITYPRIWYNPDTQLYQDEGEWLMAIKGLAGTGLYRHRLTGISTGTYYMQASLQVLMSLRCWYHYQYNWESQQWYYDPEWEAQYDPIEATCEDNIFRIGNVSASKYIRVYLVHPGIAVNGVLCHKLRVDCGGAASFTTAPYKLQCDPEDIWVGDPTETHMPEASGAIRLSVLVASGTAGRIKLEVKEIGGNSPWRTAGTLSKLDTKMSTTFNRACWGIEALHNNAEAIIFDTFDLKAGSSGDFHWPQQ